MAKPRPRGPRLASVRSAGVRQDLKASLMFSPACLSFELDWSALPSAWRLSSSVALPTPSLTLPASSSDLLSILSSAAIGYLQEFATTVCLRLGCTRRRHPQSSYQSHPPPADRPGRAAHRTHRPASDARSGSPAPPRSRVCAG